MNGTKNMKKKANHSRQKSKIIRQKKDDEDLSAMPPLECDEEKVKKGKALKILTPNKLLTRLPILLAQIKAENNSYDLKNEIRQILYLLYQRNNHQKNLKQLNKAIIMMEENMILIKEHKTSYFDFDWPKDVDENLKHKIEFIIKNNESLRIKQKMRLNNYCSNINKIETIFMNTENSKMSEPHKFVLNLS